MVNLDSRVFNNLVVESGRRKLLFFSTSLNF